jgi:hypothetical protein
MVEVPFSLFLGKDAQTFLAGRQLPQVNRRTMNAVLNMDRRANQQAAIRAQGALRAPGVPFRHREQQPAAGDFANLNRGVIAVLRQIFHAEEMLAVGGKVKEIRVPLPGKTSKELAGCQIPGMKRRFFAILSGVYLAEQRFPVLGNSHVGELMVPVRGEAEALDFFAGLPIMQA